MAGQRSEAAVIQRDLQIRRADSSTLNVEVYDRGLGAADRALVVVQGSTCNTTQSLKWFDQVMRGAATRWVVVVAKDGSSGNGACGAGYEAHATEEARWFDHLVALRRVKQELHLRSDGAFQLLAVSAGGLTACAVAGATQDVSAVALLSTGGGITFEQELGILTKGDPRFAERRRRVQTDPRLGQTWMGDTNPEIWWWSVLDKRCLPLLDNYRGPVFVAHGLSDTSTPIESARSLVESLKARRLDVTSVELPTEHDLGLSTLPANENGIGRALAWLKTH
ncbi:S9 family peptidase [Sphingomonas sp. ID1715]|uniref:alpha/beta hydrolase family protein n=1 Tax=Sphingomonas sp. ID1715 TaxID=1656898 RepID=UPI001C2C8E00|nr:hypothetical protein [Sphingomonas sp. ID1715]